MNTSQPPVSHVRRPLSVTILVLVVLIFTCLGMLRLVTAIQLQEFLTGLSEGVPVVYLIATGAFWFLMGLAIAFGLFTGRVWAIKTTQIVAVFYAVVYWFDRLILAEPSAIANRWPFVAMLTIGLMGFTFWVLSRPKTQAFLRNR